ncbi:MAG: hypothetical protein IPF81_15025 [Bacteroidetes bacterium]|nr:hypothetical protein [Bacteroidota bacterium]
MNFNLLHLQRKFTVLCSAAGVFSIFLPWVSVTGGFINVSMNGFRGFGIIAFIAYGLAVLFLFSAISRNAWTKRCGWQL